MTTARPTRRQVAQHRDPSHQLPSSGSWNSARRGSPVSRATSFAAALRVCPGGHEAAPPAARAGRAGRASPGRLPTASPELPTAPPDPPATTMVTSPRGGSADGARRERRRASHAGPARGAWSAPGRGPPRRSGPQAPARSRRVAAVRPGASNRTVVRSSAAMRASRSRRSRPRRGRNPSNAQRGAGMPLATSAASTADGTRDGHDPATLVRPGAHQLAARVAHQRRAGVRDERHVITGAQPRQQLRRRAGRCSGRGSSRGASRCRGAPTAGASAACPRRPPRPPTGAPRWPAARCRPGCRWASRRRTGCPAAPSPACTPARCLSHPSIAAGAGDRGSRCPRSGARPWRWAASGA